MQRVLLGLALLLPAIAPAAELDILPLGNPDLAYELGSAEANTIYDTAAGTTVTMEELALRLAETDVVLLGEEHTAMDQKLFHAELVDAMASTGKSLVLALEFFQRDDRAVLGRWARGEIDDRTLLHETGWYDRGGYRWEYYRPVMEIARRHGMSIVGVNVPREIPRTVNRSGLDGLTEEQRSEVGLVGTDGSPQHRYLISRYFGDTASMLPPGWFDNMYAAQCLWDVVMARSILEEVAEDTTVVLVVGSGHLAYDLGIPRRLDDERDAAESPRLRVATFCPATAPAPPDDGEPTGHPMGGGGHGMGESAGPPAQFARSLADYVAVFPDHGGIEAFPTIGLKLKADGDQRPVVSMVWPDTLASTVGFASGDRIVDIGGVVPKDLADFRFLLAGIEWGLRLGIRVMRDDETVEIGALLFPTVESIDRTVAPGYVVEALDAFDPRSSVGVTESVVPEDRARWSLVTDDGVPVRAEVRIDNVLEEVYLLDENGRAAWSMYRIVRDGVVAIRYERDEAGAVVATTEYDRTGAVID